MSIYHPECHVNYEGVRWHKRNCQDLTGYIFTRHNGIVIF
jgi:hypothetical protein